MEGGYRLPAVPGLELQARAERMVFDDSAQEDETLLLVGIKYFFNGAGRYENLFKGRDRAAMVASDLIPVSGTESIALDGRQYMAKKTVNEIDKTALRTRLGNLIDRARHLNELDYTPSSWSNLDNALNYAVSVYNKG